MKLHEIAFVLIFVWIFLVLAGCTQAQAPPPEVTQSPEPVNVSIVSDNPHYSLTWSSSPGMGLSPDIGGGGSGNNVSYHWKTDYGTFLSWTSPDYQVLTLGPDVVVTHPKVYWSYGVLSEGQSRPVVHISLELIDSSTGATLAYTTRTIRWAEGDLAEIQ